VLTVVVIPQTGVHPERTVAVHELDELDVHVPAAVVSVIDIPPAPLFTNSVFAVKEEPLTVVVPIPTLPCNVWLSVVGEVENTIFVDVVPVVPPAEVK